jgi:hypothetical protein
LFLRGHVRAAFIVTVAVSQLWRIASEFFRADYRGEGPISAYQIMSAASIAYAAALVLLPLDGPAGSIDITAGLRLLWQPAGIIGLQALWMFTFLYTGCSMVTSSTLSFHVRHGRV